MSIQGLHLNEDIPGAISGGGRLRWLRASLIAGVALVLTLVVLFLWQPVHLFHRNDYKLGKEVIAKVERYRRDYGKLPESLENIGFDDPDMKVFYERSVDSKGYVVWFGTWLGESELYDSETRQWRAAH